MYRYKLQIEYDGGPFVGWQRQGRGQSVQGAVEAAIKKFCQTDIIIYAAGRTDAGVHAFGQVIHFDLPREVAADRVRDAVNFHLKPLPVAVLSAERVAEDFHARFSAIGRAYLYRIVTRRPPLTLDEGRAWRVPVALDADSMAAGARHLLGHHDFTTFRASDCQAKSPLKTLDLLEVTRLGDEIRVTVAARSFLHHQVRNMVGTLKMVGEGKWSPDDVGRALAARDRAQGGPTAPAYGLYLTGVSY